MAKKPEPLPWEIEVFPAWTELGYMQDGKHNTQRFMLHEDAIAQRDLLHAAGVSVQVRQYMLKPMIVGQHWHPARDENGQPIP